MANKTPYQVEAQKNRLIAQNASRYNRDINRVSPGIAKAHPELKKRYELRNAADSVLNKLPVGKNVPLFGGRFTKRLELIQTAASNATRAAYARQRAAPAKTVTAIKKAAAGGDPYAKAWATRIAKYGPTGVAGGKGFKKK